ncbi:hypothetical protein Tco_1552121, partial [Tanacetum coccineum]
MGGLPSFESGFGKGQVVLDFENSAVSMPSAERDIRKLAVFNDGSWLGLNVVTGFYRDDSYNCECSSNIFGVNEGYIYGGPSLWEAMRTTNASNIGFHDEDMSVCTPNSSIKAETSLMQGRDYRAQFQLGNGELVAANYIQILTPSFVTPNFSLGGEVFWAGQQHKSGLGYGARCNTDKM